MLFINDLCNTNTKTLYHTLTHMTYLTSISDYIVRNNELIHSIEYNSNKHKWGESVGETTTPCGTPSLIFTLSLRCPSTFTRVDLSWRKLGIHLYIRPDTPAWSTLRSNPSLHTLSKALYRS